MSFGNEDAEFTIATLAASGRKPSAPEDDNRNDDEEASLSALAFDIKPDDEFEATPKPLQLANVPSAIAETTAFMSRDFIQVRQGILISKETK